MEACTNRGMRQKVPRLVTNGPAQAHTLQIIFKRVLVKVVFY